MIGNLKEREKEILRYLYEENESSVSELSKKLKVSVVTIRSDLEKLEKKGFAVKTHGGAQPVYNKAIIERLGWMSEEKCRIAKKAAELINDGDRVIILAGTTSSLIGKYLYDKRDVHIVTNSTYLLNYVRNNANIKVTLIGGEFIPDAEATVGAIALRELENFSVKMCFIGSDGFSLKNGITANHIEVAEIAKKVAERSETTVLVTDSSKYNKNGFAFIQSANKVNAIITDDKFPSEELVNFKEQGVEMILV
ncbi:DeoR/GlpR transcriptional regulator [Puteibacter caeruleilacunae]|nr:DeoR/GlpR transcriptional regulator [Puteibacter caeruleilacunae]